MSSLLYRLVFFQTILLVEIYFLYRLLVSLKACSILIAAAPFPFVYIQNNICTRCYQNFRET